MKISLGFFGFVRNFDINILPFLKLFPSETLFDIYVFIPNKIEEFGDEFLTKEKIVTKFSEIKQISNINISIYSYDPKIFIEKSTRLNYPFINSQKIYPYRVLSLFYSISNLSKFILNSRINYDMTILTRFDIINTISSLGDCIKMMDNNICIWRTIPYISNIHAEDRIIISSIQGIEYISHLYDQVDNIELNECELIAEIILQKYLNLNEKLIKEPQKNIIIGFSPSFSCKYSEEFKKRCEKIYNI